MIIFMCVPHLNFTWEPGARKKLQEFGVRLMGSSNDGCALSIKLTSSDSASRPP